AEYAEGIDGGVEIGLAGLAFALGAVGAHLPGRPMAGQRILLEARHRVRVHALEEIVGLVIFAHMVQAEMKIFALIAAALRRAVRSAILTVRPFAGDHFLARAFALRAGLVRLDADAVEEFR